MHRASALVATLVLAWPASAQQTRQLDAHEHGVGLLNIAFEGGQVAIELEAPGADIVGFEHPAESDEERSAISAAIADLAKPLDLFAVPGDAGCTVVEAHAALISDEDDHDAHDHSGHDAHDHDKHDHGDKDEHAHDEHDHGDKDEHAHDDHGHDKDGHDEHAHDDHNRVAHGIPRRVSADLRQTRGDR